MKRTPLVFILSILLHVAISPASAVPPEVEDAFKTRYPDAGKAEWEVDSNGYWEAGFEIGGTKHRADFNEMAEWVETEVSVKFDELPDPVQRAIREEFGDDEITEIEKVDSAQRGSFFDVEFKRSGKNHDVEYLESGEKAPPPPVTLENATSMLFEPLTDLNSGAMRPDEIGRIELLMEFGFNLLTIIIYSYVIYYWRHHDHKMLFLLLGFNLFLFPIFLLNSVLTAGIGFTIFALLALVRLRSDTFDKTEVAYLLGAVALTLINAVLPARVEYLASLIVLATAFFADHPKIWRDAFQTTVMRLPLEEMGRMLDPEFLRKRIEDDFGVIVNDVEILRVERKRVFLRVMYRQRVDEQDSRDRPSKKRRRKD